MKKYITLLAILAFSAFGGEEELTFDQVSKEVTKETFIDFTTTELRVDGVDVGTFGTGDMVLADIQTVTGAKTFDTGKLILDGATSGTIIVNATAIAGSNTLTLPAATDVLIGKATVDILTNKTIDANGTGNSISNIDVADLANGTDGELITWDAAGAPATVATGAAGEVLTSNGAGSAPTMAAIPTNTGEVTGDTNLTVDKTAISNKTLVTPESGDMLLIGDSSDSDNLKRVDVSSLLSGASLVLTWSFSTTTTEADPGSGNMRWDNATPASVLNIFVSTTSGNSVDLSTVLGGITAGDQVYIQQKSESGAFILATIGTPVDNTTWWKFPVTIDDSGTLPQNNRDVAAIILLHGGAGGGAVDSVTGGEGITNSGTAADPILDMDIASLAVQGTPGSGMKLVVDNAGTSEKIDWDDLPGAVGGEANTGSNQGTDGVGVFDTKAGIDLQFRHIAPASGNITVALNGKDIDLNLNTVLDFSVTQLREGKGADVVSAATLTLGSDGNFFDITGTTTVTAIGAKAIGTKVIMQFDAVLILTHSATDLILPTGEPITTAAGDVAEFIEYASADWICTNYTRADGTPLAGGAGGSGWVFIETQSISSSISTIDFTTGIGPTYDNYVIIFNDVDESASSAMGVRVSIASSFQSDAQYVSYRSLLSTGNDTRAVARSMTETNVRMSGTTASSSGRIYISNVNSTTQTAQIDAYQVVDDDPVASTWFRTESWGGYLGSTAAVDGFQLILSSGTYETGEFTLFTHLRLVWLN